MDLEVISNRNWLENLIIIGIVLLLITIAYYIIARIFKLFARRDGRYLHLFYQKLKGPSLPIFLVLGVMMVLPYMDMKTAYKEPIRHMLSLLLTGFVAWLFIRLVAIGREALLMAHDITQKNNLKARKIYTQSKILSRILIFLIILVAVASGLMTFEKVRQMGVTLLASAGLAGIILGFAAQKLISTVLAGIQLAITQPIRVDDVVIVEKEWGRIEEITLTYVVIKIWDERRLIVPTIYFMEHPFQNWTRISAEILGTVFIYTDYTMPVEPIREKLTELLEGSELWDKRVNVLQVTDASDTVIEIRALMSSFDSGMAWDLRVMVREKLIEFLQENYPQHLPRTRVEMHRDPNSKTDDPQGVNRPY